MSIKTYVQYSSYHLWAVLESKFNSVIASFDTREEAETYSEDLKKGLDKSDRL